MDVDNPSGPGSSHDSHPQLLGDAVQVGASPDGAGQADSEDDGSSTVDGIGSLLQAAQATLSSDSDSTGNQSHHDRDIDLESRAWGEDILATIARPVAAWDTTI
jgi:hypothetical protein